jgi:hypothetical protein
MQMDFLRAEVDDEGGFFAFEVGEDEARRGDSSDAMIHRLRWFGV